MTLTNEQTEELRKPLDRAHVKQREQGRSTLSYVESWHVIAEANRIFGFDGWTCETVHTSCVAQHERKIGRPPHERDGWGVTYTAKVRVTVGAVVREGTGAGHGIDADIGLAHESAIKEAESDARKRALMTFGNPFGLALYDKTQANVADEPAPPQPAPKMSVEDYLQSMNAAANLESLQALFKEAWKVHPGPNSRTTIKNHYDARKAALSPMPATLGDHLDNLHAAEKAALQ